MKKYLFNLNYYDMMLDSTDFINDLKEMNVEYKIKHFDDGMLLIGISEDIKVDNYYRQYEHI